MRREERGRRDHEPVDLRQGAGAGRRLRRAGPRPGPAQAWTWRRRSARSPPTTSAGPATCCSRPTTPRAAWTAGSRSRSTRGSRTTSRPDHRRGQGPVVAGRPAEPVHQDPGHPGQGLPAITATLAAGISVNVTLIFCLERYDAVMEAFLAGLEQAKANGHDLSQLASVASFFVSRVDTEIDKRLDKLGSDEAKALRGQGRRRQRPARLPALRAGLRVRPLAGAGRRRRPAAAPAVGLDRREGPRVQGHHVRRGAGRARHGQHDAGGDPGRGRRPRRGPRRHRHRQLRGRRRQCWTTWPRSASTTTTSSDLLEREGVEKFEDVLERAARVRAATSSTTAGVSR